MKIDSSYIFQMMNLGNNVILKVPPAPIGQEDTWTQNFSNTPIKHWNLAMQSIALHSLIHVILFIVMWFW